jgi:hypothetical protein
MMKTTKEFWSRKQFTDSSTMEQWMSSKQQQQLQNNNNNRDELESASVGGKTLFFYLSEPFTLLLFELKSFALRIHTKCNVT